MESLILEERATGKTKEVRIGLSWTALLFLCLFNFFFLLHKGLLIHALIFFVLTSAFIASKNFIALIIIIAIYGLITNRLYASKLISKKRYKISKKNPPELVRKICQDWQFSIPEWAEEHNPQLRTDNESKDTFVKTEKWHKKLLSRVENITCGLLESRTAIAIILVGGLVVINSTERDKLPNTERDPIQYAAISCKIAAENAAKWDYESDWGLKYEAWDGNPPLITIVGRDIKFQNGFGAWRYAPYRCVYDLDTERVVSLTID